MATSDPLTILMPTFSSENPYHSLLSDALEHRGIQTVSAELPPIFPLTLEGVISDEITIVHLDWIYQFYMTTPTTSKTVNTILTVVRSVTYLLDLLITSVSSTGLVWTIHDIRHGGNNFPRIERLVKEIGLLVSDQVIVKCDLAADMIEAEYVFADSDDFQVIRDGNYSEGYPNNISREAARRELSTDSDRFIYLFFGFIREYKGVDILLDVFKNIDQSEVDLWVVGNPDNDNIEKMIRRKSHKKDNINLELEYIPVDLVQNYMNAADVLVLPFREILNSGSVYLGLTFGLPIVTPKMGCIPTTVSEKNMEFMYDGSSEGLRQALESAYESPELDEVAEANRRRGKELDWEEPARQLSELYQSVRDREG